MSTFILMKILESTPSRYDWGIRLLTLGRLDAVYDRLCARIQAGQKVLDIGCGTGALTRRAAARGAAVKGIDINAQMLEIARQRLSQDGLAQQVVLEEKGVAEMSEEPDQVYDIVTAGLSLSELSADELRYTLDQAWRILKPEGLLLIADEIQPAGFGQRWLQRLLRLPWLIIVYLLTQTTTRAIPELPQKLIKTGFQVESSRPSTLGSFIEIIARKPVEDDS